jgi:uncharacterized membrane protein YqaE (UPF0057 family)
LSRFAVESGDRRLRIAEGRIGKQEGEEDQDSEEDFVMKALRYFFCVVFPPFAVLMTGRIASFFLSLILTLLGWIPGVIHACLVVNDYHAEKRAAAGAH